MTATSGPEQNPLSKETTRMHVDRLSGQLAITIFELDSPRLGEKPGVFPIRPLLPDVPATAWDAFDAQALVRRELGKDASTEALAFSVAKVVAASAGPDHDISDIVVGPTGSALRGKFVDRFAQRLVDLASIPTTDTPSDRGELSLGQHRLANERMRNARYAQLSQHQRELERYLREALRNEGQLVPNGQRNKDMVWVRKSGNDVRQEAVAWELKPLSARVSLLVEVALTMFNSAFRGNDNGNRFSSLPTQYIFPHGSRNSST